MGAGFTGRPEFTLESAAAFLIEHGEWGGSPGDPAFLIDDALAPELIATYYRAASRTLHPDAGGDPDLFVQLGEARRVLDEHPARSAVR